MESHPARPGDYIEIYCTALGPTRSGSRFAQTLTLPRVYIGSYPAAVQDSEVTTVPGLYQVNVQVPAGVRPGKQTIVISMGVGMIAGLPSDVESNPGWIAIQ